jgi:hypothetical protein
VLKHKKASNFLEAFLSSGWLRSLTGGGFTNHYTAKVLKIYYFSKIIGNIWIIQN